MNTTTLTSPSYHEFEEFTYNTFDESGIKPSLYKHCTRIHQDKEHTDGYDLEYPIHEGLNWKQPARFPHQVPPTIYACFFLNETDIAADEIWQAMIWQYDEEKERNYVYRAPTNNGDRAFLPPIPNDIRQLVEQRYGVKIPVDTGFWEWVAKNKHIPIIITEGAKKALALLSNGYVAIALYGCSCGGKEELIPDLARFLISGRTWLFGFDRDDKDSAIKAVTAGKTKIRKHLVQSDYKVFVEDIIWKAEDGKGVDDFIANRGTGAFDIAYSKAVAKLEKQYAAGATTNEDELVKVFKPKELKVAQEIAKKCQNVAAFNDETKAWMRYGGKKNGMWAEQSNEMMESLIYKSLVSEKYRSFSASLISNVTRLIRHELITEEWREKPAVEFLPFINGVYDIKNKKLLDHSPEYKFTWQLPRNYEPDGTWENINQYLDHLSGYSPKMKDILLCYCNAVLKGRSDLQKCLYLIGHPGTGKGTFLRLLSSMVGQENIHGTKLEIFCADKFDIVNVRNKRLVLFSDQAPYSGSVSEFLALTGQDYLRGEKKKKNDPIAFPFTGMAIIAANYSVFFGKVLNAVGRRLIHFPCNTLVPPEMKKDLTPLFEPEIGAFTAYVLGLSDDHVTAVLDEKEKTKECTIETWETRMADDGMASWVNDCLIFDDQAATQVGKNRNELKDGEPYTLFGSYAKYVEQTGRGQCNANRFSNDLIDLCSQQMMRPVEKDKKTRHIKGVRLRIVGTDDHIPTYDVWLEENSKGDNPGTTSEQPQNNLGNNLEPLLSKDGADRNNLEATLVNNISQVNVGCEIKPGDNLGTTLVQPGNNLGNNLEPLPSKDGAHRYNLEATLENNISQGCNDDLTEELNLMRTALSEENYEIVTLFSDQTPELKKAVFELLTTDEQAKLRQMRDKNQESGVRSQESAPKADTVESSPTKKLPPQPINAIPVFTVGNVVLVNGRLFKISAIKSGDKLEGAFKGNGVTEKVNMCDALACHESKTLNIKPDDQVIPLVGAYKNKPLEVTSTDKNTIFCKKPKAAGILSFYGHQLEVVKPTSTLKIGDRVKVAIGTGVPHEKAYLVSNIGTIESCAAGKFKIKFDATNNFESLIEEFEAQQLVKI
jgi:putative DNA primase/helicase